MHRPVLPIAILLLLPAATAPAAMQRLHPVPAPRMGPYCDDLDPHALADALDHQIAALLRRPARQALRFGNRTVAPADYARDTLVPLSRLARRGRDALCTSLPRLFTFYRGAGGGQGKFTAYHHPVLHGSRHQQGLYRYPLYRRPPKELATLTTARILAGGLQGQGLELVYLDDPTAALDVHIEGSALIRLLDEGRERMINVTTDGHNGGRYQNISRLLLADRKIPRDQITPPGLTRARKFFQDHPEELWTYWAKNPHFVFFRETDQQGTGKFGELVPGRSLAVDRSVVPMGAAVWIRSEKPVLLQDRVAGFVRYARVGLAQDTGAAIAGSDRVDVFLGTGEQAQREAVATSRAGEMYVLLGKGRQKKKGGRSQ